ncbi:PPE family protein [Mycobacterium kiyosense]
MDFGALPPEVNSALMYAGAGAAPMLAAGAAWNGVAAELSAAASDFEAVITRLTTEEWLSPAARAMAAAAQPFSVWLSCTADCLAFAGEQARASAAAFETAFRATVPPAEVAANRARLTQLTATNTFGQNVSAIAAAEARYGEMWAQDAAAMYGYAASSAAAGRLDALRSPSAVADPAAAPAQQTALAHLVDSGPNAVLSLAAPAASTSPAAVGGIGGGSSGCLPGSTASTIRSSRSSTTSRPFTPTSVPISRTSPCRPTTTTTISPISPQRRLRRGPRLGAPAVPAGATPVVAASGAASSVGRLSVPTGWYVAAPARAGEPTSVGTGWAVPGADDPMDVLPGAPAVVVDGARPVSGPRYGVRPTVMPKHGVV